MWCAYFGFARRKGSVHDYSWCDENLGARRRVPYVLENVRFNFDWRFMRRG